MPVATVAATLKLREVTDKLPHGTYLSICRGATEVGFMHMGHFGLGAGFIDNLANLTIHPAHRGHGYARQALRLLQQRYPCGIALYAKPPLAQGLYAKEGFERTNPRVNRWPDFRRSCGWCMSWVPDLHAE